MKIALINENSQAAKNGIILTTRPGSPMSNAEFWVRFCSTAVRRTM